MPSLPRTQVLVLEMIRGGTVVFLEIISGVVFLEMIRGGGTVVLHLFFFQRNLMTIDWAENITAVPLHLFLHH